MNTLKTRAMNTTKPRRVNLLLKPAFVLSALLFMVACTKDDDNAGGGINCPESVNFNYIGQTVTYGTVISGNRCWLDRNLGATQVATSPTDQNAYGDLFQWGRRDDGHQNRTSSTTSTMSSTDQPPHGSYILSPFESDWRSPQNNNLWQGVNGINNPCPAGYRVPTEAEWNQERLSWSSNGMAGAFASPLKLTAAGYRGTYDGSLYNVDSSGYYWSSSVSGLYARRLNIGSSNAAMGDNGRASGGSVRCIKD